MFIFFTHYFYCFLLVFVNLLRRFALPTLRLRSGQAKTEPKEKALSRQVFFKAI